MASVVGISNISAGVVAYLGAAPVYSRTVGWIQRYTANNYGFEYVEIAGVGWFLVCVAGIFFVARASIGTALVMGGLAITARLLV